MRKKIMRIFIAVAMIAVVMMPTTVLAAKDFSPYNEYIVPNTDSNDDDIYITVEWTTTDPVGLATLNSNIKKTYWSIVFYDYMDNVELISTENWHDYFFSTAVGFYFKPDVLKTKGAKAYAVIKLGRGKDIKTVAFRSHVDGARQYAGEVRFFPGKYPNHVKTQIGDTVSFQLKGDEKKVKSFDAPFLWSLEHYSMNSVGINSVSLSYSNTRSLPSGSAVSIPIDVSAKTALGTDAANAYSDIVWGKITKFSYTNETDYGDSIQFSGKNLIVDESIYDKIGDQPALSLNLVAEVTQTYTKEVTKSAEHTITLERPKVNFSCELDNITTSYYATSVYYRTKQEITLNAAAGYRLPDSITVTSGGKTLSAGTDYTYDAATGKVAVSDKAVTGDIKIKAGAAKLLDNIADALPDFEDKWYTTESSVLNTADGWTVSTSQYGSFTGSVTLDGEGVSLTKSLYFRDGSGKLYYYKLTYKRDTVSPVIDSITNPGGSGSKEISFNVSDSVSGIQSVTVTCNDNDPVTYDNDSFTADRNGSYTITVTDNAGNRSIEYVTVSDLHTHSYTYAVSQGNAAQIIESCSCGHKQTAVLSCTGSGSYTYTGSAITPVNVTYSDGWVGERPTTFSYSDNINAGTGKASITIEGVNAVKSFEITKAVPVLTDPAAQNGITYGGSLSSVVLTTGWSWEDADTVPTVSNSGYTAYYIPSDTANYDWTQIQGWNQTDGRVERTVSVGVSKADLTVNIQKASSVYGDGIAELKATAVGIVNGDTDVYSLSTTATGTSDVGNYDITGTTNNGNYNITFTGGTDAYTITRRELTVTVEVSDKRYDGTKNAEIISAVLGNAANGDNITLNSGTAAFATEKVGTDISISLAGFYISGEKSGNYTLTLPTDIKADITNGWNPEADTEYTASEPNGNGWLNEDMVITAKNGYKVSLTDTADGEWKDTLTGAAEGSDGSVKFYVKNITDGTISEMVTVNYRLDKGNPDGKVYFDERNSWKEFLDTITFDLFYGSKVTVKADAQDSISGIAGIEFIEASVQMSLEELRDSSIAWEELPEGGKDITVEDGKSFICYIRITDNAGNVIYISTDGAEYDTTAPVINGVENGKTYYTTQTVTVTDDNVASITLNGEAAGADITLNGNEDKVYTITVTDKAGNETTAVVTMKPIAAVNESIEGITVDNVKSSDKETIENVIGQIDGLLKFAGLTDEERNILSSAKQEAEELIRKIMEAADENRDISEQIAALDKNTATSSDKQAVQDLIDRAEELLNGNNLTDEEREALEEVKGKAGEVVEQIDAVAEESGELTEQIAALDKNTATSSDKQAVQDLIDRAEELLNGNNLTDEEREVLEQVKEKAVEVVEQIEEAGKSTVTENTDKVEDITSENVTPEDKTDLEGAKADLEEALKEHGSNMTEDEKKSVQEEINRIDDAIAVVKKVEDVQELIGKLSDIITSGDADAVRAAQEAYEKLTDYEKSFVDKKKLDEVVKAFEKLSENTNSPNTGDNMHIALWSVLMLLTAFVTVKVSTYDKKKKQIK